MRVEFLLEANSELILAADRYDAENPRVGIDFISEKSQRLTTEFRSLPSAGVLPRIQLRNWPKRPD